MITDSPTPPQPITATEEPASTPAVLMTAPTPVATPQPIRQATSNGSSGGITHGGGRGHDGVGRERADRQVLADRPVGAS